MDVLVETGPGDIAKWRIRGPRPNPPHGRFHKTVGHAGDEPLALDRQLPPWSTRPPELLKTTMPPYMRRRRHLSPMSTLLPWRPGLPPWVGAAHPAEG